MGNSLAPAPSRIGDPVSAAPRRGTAAAALANREFRLVYVGSLLSNVGTWMQNVVLPAFVYTRTDSASLVGLMIVAQLGPLFVLAIPAGAIADRVDRRRWLVSMQMVQLAFSAVIGVLALGDPSFAAVFAAALGVGIGNALNAPAWSALVPSLVGPEDMPGAISLNSFAINGSRVIGPIVVAGLSALGLGASAFFFINAVTYLFVVVALLNVHVPAVAPERRKRSTPGVGPFSLATAVTASRDTTGLSNVPPNASSKAWYFGAVAKSWSMESRAPKQPNEAGYKAPVREY
ncbi:MAG: MFS transporter [Actinobacteria bacterium]|nr:MFS transporter [Actinomycetota bacterium]